MNGNYGISPHSTANCRHNTEDPALKLLTSMQDILRFAGSRWKEEESDMRRDHSMRAGPAFVHEIMCKISTDGLF